jgi:hypothetical protein
MKLHITLVKTICVGLCLFASACTKDSPSAPSSSIRGCTVGSATNYNSRATEDDGSCAYPRVIFYVTAPPSPVAMPVTVSVDGAIVGNATVIYSSVPGNCIADGTVGFQLKDAKSHDWNSRTAPDLPGGGLAVNAGTFSASSGSASDGCIKVRVF